MYVAFTFIMFLAALIIQTSMLGWLTCKPDIVLVIVVYLGLMKGPEIGCLSGFFSGLMLDAFSGVPFGTNALSKIILGFVSGIVGKRLYTQSLITHILCVAIATAIDTLIVLSFQGFELHWQKFMLYEILENIVCCPVIVLLFRAGERRLRTTTY